MTRAATLPTIRCSPTGPARSACRRSPRSSRSISARPSTAPWPRTAPRSTPSPPIRRRRASPTPSRRWRRSGRELDRVSNVFFVLAGADTGDAIEAVEREVSPLLARHSNAIYLNRALYARIADLYARRDSARPQRRAGARARPLSHPLRAGRRRARPAGAGSPGGDQRAAGEPRHPIRPERAGRRESLRADAGGGRSRRPAGLRARRRARGGRGARRRPANTPSRWRARRARASCSSPRAATCARRSSRPGSSAARTAARPTTAR